MNYLKKLLRTVAPRYNAVIGMQGFGRLYKRGALKDSPHFSCIVMYYVPYTGATLLSGRGMQYRYLNMLNITRHKIPQPYLSFDGFSAKYPRPFN